MQNFWGANKAYHGRCATGEWKFKIERKLAEEMGRGLLLPFSLSVVPYALFFPLTPGSPPLRHKEASSNRTTLGAKDFSSANSVTFTFFTPKHPVTCEENLWYQGYRMAYNN